MLEIPYDIRDGAVKDLKTAYTGAFTNRERGNIDTFDLKHRSVHDISQSIYIPSGRTMIYGPEQSMIKVFPRSMERPILCAESLPEITHDLRLQWLPRLNQFYLCIPMDLSKMQGPLPSMSSRAIALDPGSRIFMAGYCPNGQIIEWAPGDMAQIYRMCRQLDDLLSRIALSKSYKTRSEVTSRSCQKRGVNRCINHKRRYKMIKASHRLRDNIHNRIDEVHKKLVAWLCENNDLILLPTFETSTMIRRGQRRLGRRSVRKLATWSHYRFQQRLLSKAREYPHCHVKLVNEAYTSKTCGRCGLINQTLGCKKIFKCKGCGIEMGRDHNGARNIMLRYLTR